MIEINVTQNNGIEVNAEENSRSVSVEVNGKIHIVGDCDTYQGVYEVTPRVYSQKLTTKEKHMQHDVQIEPIPFYEVGNQSGGYTLNIG